MQIGEYIKVGLAINSITQKELADKSGVTESAISHYIKGDRIPNIATMVRIAKVLNIDLNELKKG